MVLLPQGAGDNWPNARRCAELGAGVVVEGQPPEPEAVRAAVRRVLDRPEYRARAQQLQGEIKQLPGLSEAVTRLERLARTQKPQF